MQDTKPLIDWSSYLAYENYRISNPDVPYYKWRAKFQDAAVFEEIYDRHLSRILKSCSTLCV